MINSARNILTALLLCPLIVRIYGTVLFSGKRKAVLVWGPVVTSLAKKSLRFWVPEIQSAMDFDLFRAKMRSNLRYWRPFFAVRVVEDTKDTLRINISSCPVCAVFKVTGLADLNPYLCKGDWAKADENRDKWLFEREHQIGTGDRLCDHTYKRLVATPKTD